MHTLHRPSPRPCRVRRRRSAGVALIEALIGILILAFGVLGLVGLQASMMRAQTGSKVRADAAALANELLATAWGDTRNLARYDGGGCASHDPCADWADKVARMLPKGSGAVTVRGASVIVTLDWTMPDAGAHRFTTQTTVTP
jgi:type IV pilus assembly protein PilV